jgi:hypothetical protein
MMSDNFLAWQQACPKSEDIPADHISQPAFIYLSNANVLVASSFTKAGFVNCKSTSVDGFLLGAMS